MVCLRALQCVICATGSKYNAMLESSKIHEESVWKGGSRDVFTVLRSNASLPIAEQGVFCIKGLM